jgi:hypothetical protein
MDYIAEQIADGGTKDPQDDENDHSDKHYNQSVLSQPLCLYKMISLHGSRPYDS